VSHGTLGYFSFPLTLSLAASAGMGFLGCSPLRGSTRFGGCPGSEVEHFGALAANVARWPQETHCERFWIWAAGVARTVLRRLNLSILLR